MCMTAVFVHLEVHYSISCTSVADPKPHEWHVCLHESGILHHTLFHSLLRKQRHLLFQARVQFSSTFHTSQMKQIQICAKETFEIEISRHSVRLFIHSSWGQVLPYQVWYALRRLCASMTDISCLRLAISTRNSECSRGRTWERTKMESSKGEKKRGGKTDKSAVWMTKFFRLKKRESGVKLPISRKLFFHFLLNQIYDRMEDYTGWRFICSPHKHFHCHF